MVKSTYICVAHLGSTAADKIWTSARKFSPEQSSTTSLQSGLKSWEVFKSSLIHVELLLKLKLP
uniref:Uncharacterized protein n=1 Tax=Oryza brachyantha TaxID=4533 RepID=J3M1L6_ORYBR